MLQRSTRTKVNEWVTWFNWHADKVSSYPPEKQMEWMLKAINGSYECMSLVAEEMNQQGRAGLAGFKSERGILIPRTWRWEGRNAASGR